MSKASAWAEQAPPRWVGTRDCGKGVPSAHVTPIGDLAVWDDGDDSGDAVHLAPEEAVALAKWILETFGGPEDRYTLR